MSFQTVDDVHRFVESAFRSVPVRPPPIFVRHRYRSDYQANCFYAIYTGPLGPEPGNVDPEDYTFAGSIGLINSSRDDMVSELGYIQILKPFQVRRFTYHRYMADESEPTFYPTQQA